MFAQLRLVNPPHPVTFGPLEPTLSAALGCKLGLRVEGGDRPSFRPVTRAQTHRDTASVAAANPPSRPLDNRPDMASGQSQGCS